MLLMKKAQKAAERKAKKSAAKTSVKTPVKKNQAKKEANLKSSGEFSKKAKIILDEAQPGPSSETKGAWFPS